MNLTHDAMLVSLRINIWSGRLYDRQASQQVAIHPEAVWINPPATSTTGETSQ